jgi:hypothetical protein
MLKKINGFELQPEVFLVNNRPCKLYLPCYGQMDSGKKLYWVEFLDKEDVNIVFEQDLVLVKNGKLLYGNK